MFNGLRRLLGLSSTHENSHPANANPAGPVLIQGSSHPQPVYWNGLPYYQGIFFMAMALEYAYVIQGIHIRCLEHPVCMLNPMVQ